MDYFNFFRHEPKDQLAHAKLVAEHAEQRVEKLRQKLAVLESRATEARQEVHRLALELADRATEEAERLAHEVFEAANKIKQ